MSFPLTARRGHDTAPRHPRRHREPQLEWVLTVLLFLWQAWSMASPEHPGSPGWKGPITQCTARTQQEAPAAGPDLPHPGPDRHLGGLEARDSVWGRGLKAFKVQMWVTLADIARGPGSSCNLGYPKADTETQIWCKLFIWEMVLGVTAGEWEWQKRARGQGRTSVNR